MDHAEFVNKLYEVRLEPDKLLIMITLEKQRLSMTSVAPNAPADTAPSAGAVEGRPFRREERYFVLKVADMANSGFTKSECQILDTLLTKLTLYRLAKGKKRLQCVVVESDWPEYEPTWKAIEDRVFQESGKAGSQ